LVKTIFGAGFPKSYFIDTESGATREQYQKALEASGGTYFGHEQGSLDFKTVLSEIKELATTKHEYRTLIIDSFSKLYNTARSVAEERVGNSYGADKKEANKPARQLIRWIDQIDMNVILICHRMGDYQGTGDNRSLVGYTFDGLISWLMSLTF